MINQFHYFTQNSSYTDSPNHYKWLRVRKKENIRITAIPVYTLAVIRTFQEKRRR